MNIGLCPPVPFLANDVMPPLPNEPSKTRLELPTGTLNTLTPRHPGTQAPRHPGTQATYIGTLTSP